MHQVFASWSGGKDSCFSCYKAMASGLNVRYLLNMITEDGKRSWTHGLSPEVLQIQSQALNIPLVQRRTTMTNYEVDFKEELLAMKREGVSGGVFGDIDLDEHRQWVEKVCHGVGTSPYLPLWGQNQVKLLKDFIDLGFETIVVTAKAELFGEEWLGRRVDHNFLEELNRLQATKNITPCGEAGEYHTFVIDGPMFHHRISILETRRVLRDKHWFLEILACKLDPTYRQSIDQDQLSRNSTSR